MRVDLHPHARDRATERGATEAEIAAAIEQGERFDAKFGRTGFRRNFSIEGVWRGKLFKTKQVEVYAVEENGGWLVITLLVKYF